jgi:hypothetical protein
MQKFFIILLLTACSEYKTPNLPELDRKSFSHEEIIHRQKKIKEKIKEIDSSANAKLPN